MQIIFCLPVTAFPLPVVLPQPNHPLCPARRASALLVLLTQTRFSHLEPHAERYCPTLSTTSLGSFLAFGNSSATESSPLPPWPRRLHWPSCWSHPEALRLPSHGRCLPPPRSVHQSTVRELCLTAAAQPEPTAQPEQAVTQ
jgi:hypothetical protein